MRTRRAVALHGLLLLCLGLLPGRPAAAQVYAIQNLGTLGGSFSTPLWINAAGQVVGVSAKANGDWQPFLYSGGMMTDLGTPDVGGVAFAINTSGQVVIVGQIGNTPVRTFRTAPNRPLNPVTDDLGTLGGVGGTAGYAINDAGQVVGRGVTAGGAEHAFRTAPNRPIDPATDDLGTLGGSASEAYSISASGEVVGASQLPGNAVWHPFLYSGGVMRDLNALIPPGSGWLLPGGAVINDSGQIAGEGLLAGQRRAYLLTPVRVAALTLTRSTVVGSTGAAGKVTLNLPAPVPLVVPLTTTNAKATVPPSVTVPAGATSQSFTITTAAVTSTVSGTVSATYGGVAKYATLKVRPIGVAAVTLSPNPVVGGTPATGTVLLEYPAAPGDIVVTLSSGNAEVANPTSSSITIATGKTSQAFTIGTDTVDVVTTATLYATANGLTRGKELTVNP
jgi:probable HAF family extracellular repeat protein